jgi:hypothetical protein
LDRHERVDAELPIILNIRVPGTDAGAVDTEVYCVNVTPHAFGVAASGASMSTIDDDGTVMEHGAPPVQLQLRPGEAGRIADVVAWEWDGWVALRVVFKNLATGVASRALYSLAKGIDQRTWRASGEFVKSGYISPPVLVQPENEGHTDQRTSSAP